MPDFQTFQSRLVYAMSQKKAKQVDVVENVKASKGTVSNWYSGKTEPDTPALYMQLAAYLGVNLEWLMSGKGNPDDRTVNLSGTGNAEFIPQKIRKAPVLNWVQAGNPCAVLDNSYDEYEYFYDDGYGLQLYWLYVRGDSMEPQFFENDKILVDAERQARAGDFVIAMVDHETQATFKRYKPCGYDPNLDREYCQLVPLNDFYPVIDSRSVYVNIVGVVVKHERKLI
ncbi:peptidase [Moraxella osloensis]|uniref:LexA family protein n=1 Tax=Faucicola osloensis TaxID=34062 RepID=UPI0020049614|nr:S24 family peptidase [Moraxella osloensis]MCK6158048.1 peptidase [Moraxella osloensis]